MKYNKILKKTNDESKSAYIGWQGSQELYFVGIKKGYYNSANDLIDIVLEKGEKGRVDIQDTYIFPIMFLYRHSIEISLKLILIKLGNKNINNHHLVKIWENYIIKDLLRIKQIAKEQEVLDYIEKSLKQLESWDFNGENWKYASDNKENVKIKDWKFIDYENLRNELNKLYETLDDLYSAIEGILEVYIY